MLIKAVIGLMRAAVIAAVLFVAGCFIPIAGAIAMIFAPTPVLDYAVGHESWLFRSVSSVVIAGGLITLVAGWPAGLAYAATFGIATVLMCRMVEDRRPFEIIVLVTSATMLVCGTFAAFAAAGSPGALADTLRHSLAAGMARGEDFYKLLGMDNPLGPEAKAAVLDTTLRLTPALVAMSAASAVLMNLAVFWRWFNRERIGYRLFGDMARWSTPEWLIWVLLATGFALFVPVRAISTIALDAFVCVAAVYFCQGLAIMSFYFKMLSMPGLARNLIYFVTGIQPVLAALVCAAGIFDLWVDFRRLKPQSPEAGSFGDYL
ncbi:MAG: DUF2232 domain-containing protein [Candidatus Binataceae bacterium]|nr:DUF2232 domain-containing protein [Candidatus Binataceae bacterium]